MLHRPNLLVILFLGCGQTAPSASKAYPAAKEAPIAQANPTVWDNGAFDAGQTLCERAYASHMARIDALLSIPPKELDRLLGDSGTPIYKDARPKASANPQQPAASSRIVYVAGSSEDKERYMKGCNARSPAFQRCLTGSYAAGHHEECQAAMTPEEIERFNHDQK